MTTDPSNLDIEEYLARAQRQVSEIKAKRDEALKDNAFARLVKFNEEHPEVPVRLWPSSHLPNPDEVFIVKPTAWSLELVVAVLCDPKYVELILDALPFVKIGDTQERLPENPNYEGPFKGVLEHLNHVR